MEITLMKKEKLLANTYVKTRVPNGILAVISFLVMFAGVAVPAVIANNKIGNSGDIGEIFDLMFRHFWDDLYCIGFIVAGIAFIVMLLALMIGKAAVGSRLYVTNARVICVGNICVDLPICQVTSVVSAPDSIKVCTAEGQIMLTRLADAASVQSALIAGLVKQQLGEDETPAEAPAETPVKASVETPVEAPVEAPVETPEE